MATLETVKIMMLQAVDESVISEATSEWLEKNPVPVIQYREDADFELPVHTINDAVETENSTWSSSKIKAVVDALKLQMFDSIYPVGSIYMSVDGTEPSLLFGGTWERLKDTFLLGAGDIYHAGQTGGEAKHTLTKYELPDHKHLIDTWVTTSANKFTGTGAHMTEQSNVDNVITTIAQQSTDRWASTLQDTGNQAHNNMPPFRTVNMWERTA